MADIYFWRQVFVLTTSLFSSMSVGFMLAFPAVLNPAIMSPNSTDIRTTGDHASWIATMNGVGGLLGSFGQSPIMQMLGRKTSHCSLNVFLLIGWSIFPFANSIGALYAARFIQGISVGGVYINSIIICEYVHPTRRGYFLSIKKISIAVGTLCCHVMSTFWTWRQIAIAAAVPSLLAFVLTLFWPESPQHLALKGKFSQCETSFKWMNGNSAESQRHLKSLIKSQKESIERNKNKKISLMEWFKVFLSKGFRKAFITSTVLTLSLDLCGGYYLMAYVTQIMMELLDNQTSAIYFTVGTDILTVVALALSALVVSYAKRRTILFYSGIFTVLLMLLFSVLAYMKTVYTFSTQLLWLTGMLVIFQSFVVNVGLIPVSYAIIGEIFPLEHKGLGSCAACVIFTALYALTMKSTPVLMEHTGLYGTYAIYGVILAACFVLLYKIVPETKDRTLQDIEDEITDKHRKDIIPMEVERLMQ